MKSPPLLLSGTNSAVHLEIVPRRARAIVKLDPTTKLFDELVDETCLVTTKTAAAFRVLKGGDPEKAAWRMRQIIKLLSKVQGRAQVALWELTKPAAFNRKPRLLLLTKAAQPRSPRQVCRLTA